VPTTKVQKKWVDCTGCEEPQVTNAQVDPPVVPYWPFPGLPPNVTRRVVGGKEVHPPDRYPYQVALTWSSFGGQYCGGSLIAPGWVLSAAHCGDLGSYVQIGRWNLRDGTEDYENIEVDYEIPHPGYDKNKQDKDFMLLKLKTDSMYPPVSIDDGPPVSIDDGSDVTTIGWGTTSYAGLSSDVLREVEVDVVENSACNSMYSTVLRENITDFMICAARQGKDSCQGDSGGPLIIRGCSHSDDVLVGVVSFGYGCADALFPGVYARVSRAYWWITQMTGAPTVVGACSDDEQFEFHINAGTGLKLCAWISRNPDAVDGRRVAQCRRRKVSAACPKACDSCPSVSVCSDLKFKWNFGGKKFHRSCQWISRDCRRKAKHCKIEKVSKKCPCTCPLPTGTAASLNEID